MLTAQRDKVGFLQHKRNKYGSFKVATHFPDGRWTKHIDVLDAWTSGEIWRLEKANNRTLFNCEIVIDLDLEKGESLEDLKERSLSIAKQLKQSGFKFKIYFSGSKGYHIHLIAPELLLLKQRTRTKVRQQWLKSYGGDLQKASDNTMIALENTPHWKTGNNKVEVKI